MTSTISQEILPPNQSHSHSGIRTRSHIIIPKNLQSARYIVRSRTLRTLNSLHALESLEISSSLTHLTNPTSISTKSFPTSLSSSINNSSVSCVNSSKEFKLK